MRALGGDCFSLPDMLKIMLHNWRSPNNQHRPTHVMSAS